jgi:hypothetical protein
MYKTCRDKAVVLVMMAYGIRIEQPSLEDIRPFPGIHTGSYIDDNQNNGYGCSHEINLLGAIFFIKYLFFPANQSFGKSFQR